jgi:hypothetical protein
MPPIPINLAIEDAVSEAVIQRVLRESRQQYATATIYNRGGNGYLQRVIAGFNNAAKGTPFLVLTDLDKHQCPATLVADWLNAPKHPNLLLRVAVTEVEAWLLADRQGIAAFLGVRLDLVPHGVEQLPDPKGVLVSLACRSRKREIKKDICPGVNSTRKVGPNYNPQLVTFVEYNWNLVEARTNSESLNRLIERLENFRPIYNRQNN